MVETSYALAALVLACIFYRALKAPTGPVPPGPPRYPIIGSALSMPKEYLWLSFNEWQKTYGTYASFLTSTYCLNSKPRNVGDMVYIEALGRPILVLNKRADADALLDVRADVYSDRPRLVSDVGPGVLYCTRPHSVCR